MPHAPRLVVGLVRGIHGLRGAVRLEVLTDDPAPVRARRTAVPGRLGRDADRGLVSERRSGHPHPFPRAPGPRRRGATARPLPGGARDARRTPGGQLVLARGRSGADVTTSTGEDLGTVTDIFRTGGSEVFVVEGRRGEILVPAVASVIVDLRRPRAASWSTPRRSPSTSPSLAPASAADARPAHAERASRASTPDATPAEREQRSARPGGRPIRWRGRSGRDVTLRIDVITLFPGLFPGPLAESIPGRALALGRSGVVDAHDLRTWGLGRHRSVDDYPYGGGAGMLLRPEPVAEALDAIAPAGSSAMRILLDPGGRSGSTRLARRSWRGAEHLVLVCPRYEGIDERVRSMIDLELSIGDYVLSGGEIPALVDHRCRPAAAAGRHRCRVAGRRIVLGRVCWSIPSTPGRPSSGASPCRTSC